MQITNVMFNGGANEQESKECGVDVYITVSGGDEYCAGTLVWDFDEKEWIFMRGEGYTSQDYINKHFGGSMPTDGVGYGDTLQYAEDCIEEEFLQLDD